MSDEGREGMPNKETGRRVDRPVSEYTFRKAFSQRQLLERQEEKVTDASDRTKIHTEISDLINREDALINEVEQEGGLKGLDLELKVLRDMLAVGELSPSDLRDAIRDSRQFDVNAGIDPSDPHAGVREYYFIRDIDKITEALRRKQTGTQRGQTQTQPQSRQTRPQSSAAQQSGQSSNPTPPVVRTLTSAEREIFGEGEAFSTRWVIARGLPETITYRVNRRNNSTEEEDEDFDQTPGKFNTSEFFSSLLETGGGDPRASSMFRYLLEAYPGNSKRKEMFSAILKNGFFPLVSLKDALGSGRIDSLAKALQGGPTPQGISQWLLFDPETRRSLTLILRLQGYQVSDERRPDGSVVHDEIRGLDRNGILPAARVAFSDHENIRTSQIKEYLEKVRETVGTDPGVVRIAYIIFRLLGHPHENSKFSQELVKKYMYTGEPNSEFPNRDLAPEDIASFIGKFKDSQTEQTFGQILQEKGVEGFAVSLNRLPAERIVREWSDMQLILDMMDHIADIRGAMGTAAGLDLGRRHAKLIEEMGIPWAKRKLKTETLLKLRDPKKIQTVKEAGLTQLEREGQAVRKVWSDLFGLSKRKKEQ